jgi:hypothetical protein
MDNVRAGKKTIWVNIGAHQFHLPEGKPHAQVLHGVVTLVYPKVQALLDRYGGGGGDNTSAVGIRSTLKGSQFHVEQKRDGILDVTDPWGTKFRLVEGADDERDSRGCQPGDKSEGYAMKDLTVYVPVHSNLAGIGRFYQHVLGSPVAKLGRDMVQIKMGPLQTLTFVPKDGVDVDSHVDLRETEENPDKDRPTFLENYGIHISLYVADLPSTYQRAADLGVAYVNTRFSRRAYTLEVRDVMPLHCILKFGDW